MLEILLGIGVCGLMGKVAEADDESPIVWGGLTFLLCVASIVLVPLPLLRMLIAGVASLVAMFLFKVIAKR